MIGQCLPRHRHVEFLTFLRTIDREVPKRLHFTPPLSSWLKLVEIFFSTLTDKAIRRGICHGVPDRIDAIQTYLAAHNENPEPFTWTATTDQILEKVRCGRVTLDAIASQNRDGP